MVNLFLSTVHTLNVNRTNNSNAGQSRLGVSTMLSVLTTQIRYRALYASNHWRRKNETIRGKYVSMIYICPLKWSLHSLWDTRTQAHPAYIIRTACRTESLKRALLTSNCRITLSHVVCVTLFLQFPKSNPRCLKLHRHSSKTRRKASAKLSKFA